MSLDDTGLTTGDVMTIFVSEYEALTARVAELEAQRDKLRYDLDTLNAVDKTTLDYCAGLKSERDKLLAALRPFAKFGEPYLADESDEMDDDLHFPDVTTLELKNAARAVAEVEQPKSGQTGPER